VSDEKLWDESPTSRYHIFIELINQSDFQWQIDTIWEVLFNI